MAMVSPSRQKGGQVADLGQIKLELSGSEQSPKAGGSLSTHELRRVQKVTEQNVQAVESRIKYFRREEEKIWRDLEEVRRQASKIEEGRMRQYEKREADQAVAQNKQHYVAQNQIRVSKLKQDKDRRRLQEGVLSVPLNDKRAQGDQQRRESGEILRRKRLEEAQDRLAKSERVVAMQREQLESKLRSNQDRAERLARLRETNEQVRLQAERDVVEVEQKLPELEAQEMVCLERLQNSRIVTQTVLQELEASLGSQSAVTTLLRSKQQRSGFIPEGDSIGSASPVGNFAEGRHHEVRP
jgi:hypothetical protein